MEKTAKKAGFTVAAMILATLLSKLLGMLRQVMIASTLADSMEGVAFAAASKIPFAIFDMLFSAAVLGSFIPIYKGSLAKEPERARKFSASFLTCIAAVTAGIAVLGMIFSRQILFLAAPKLDEETAALAAGLSANAGIGLALIMKSRARWKKNLFVLFALFFFSVALGYLLLLFV